MKRNYVKMFLIGTMMLGTASYANAQEENGIFNHVAAAVEVGTTGIGFEVAAPVTNYVAVRAGLDVLPRFKYSSNVNLNIPNSLPQQYADIPRNLDIEGKLKLTNGKILIDAYPFQNSSFHLTVGAYFGGKEVVSVYNKQEGALIKVTQFNNDYPDKQIGAKIGDYLLKPDQNGNVTGSLNTKGFRPYVGFGFGRAVPQKHRFTCGFDCGIMFWGSPKIINQGNELPKQDLGGKGGFVKTMTKTNIYPCLSFKVIGRII